MAKTEKHLAAEAALEQELHGEFNILVDDYKEACREYVRGGREFVNYNILADLIQGGWRKNSQVR
jgi:hypothetical protein